MFVDLTKFVYLSLKRLEMIDLLIDFLFLLFDSGCSNVLSTQGVIKLLMMIDLLVQTLFVLRRPGKKTCFCLISFYVRIKQRVLPEGDRFE